jgi:hypothetical protein
MFYNCLCCSFSATILTWAILDVLQLSLLFLFGHSWCTSNLTAYVEIQSLDFQFETDERDLSNKMGSVNQHCSL